MAWHYFGTANNGQRSAQYRFHDPSTSYRRPIDHSDHYRSSWTNAAFSDTASQYSHRYIVRPSVRPSVRPPSAVGGPVWRHNRIVTITRPARPGCHPFESFFVRWGNRRGLGAIYPTHSGVHLITRPKTLVDTIRWNRIKNVLQRSDVTQRRRTSTCIHLENSDSQGSIPRNAMQWCTSDGE